MMNNLLRRSFIFGAAMSVATSLSAQSLRDGLEIYIPFDEGTGNEASDLSGNDRSMFPENNLFPGAEVNWSGGRFGGSAKFNYDYFMTSPDYLGIGDDAARTISFWVRLGPDDNNPNGAGGAVIGWGINATGQRMHVKFHGIRDGEGVIRQHARTENQGGNNFGNSLPFNDGNWHHYVSVFDPEVDANDDGILAAVGDFDHYIDGELESKSGGVGNPVLTNISEEEGAQPLSVGGSYFLTRLCDTRIDDFRVYNRALSVDEIQALSRGEDADGPPAVDIISKIESEEMVSTDKRIDLTDTTLGDETVAQADLWLELKGHSVAGETTFEGDENAWTGSFTDLEKNKVYQGKIGATDSMGRSYSFDFTFDTISLDNYAIEAEDFNFDGGEFFDNPVPCETPGGSEANCYFDRVSEIGIDANDDGTDDRPTDDNVDFDAFLDNGYRFGSGALKDELVDTWTSGDSLRAKFMDVGEGIRDFEIERVNTGEWYNYTRNITQGTYQIFLRARVRADQTLSLGTVSGATSSNQTVTELGQFSVSSTGGSYGFFPLKDDQGRDLVMALGGEQTLRLTAVQADNNVDLNYMMFVPATLSVKPQEITLNIASTGDQITLSWEGDGGQLQKSDQVNGNWENVSTTGNSHTITADQSAGFFRIVAP
jgi:hypothetical protein